MDFSASDLAFGNIAANFAVYLDVFVRMPLSVLKPVYAEGSLEAFFPNRLISRFLVAFFVLDNPAKYRSGEYISTTVDESFSACFIKRWGRI